MKGNLRSIADLENLFEPKGLNQGIKVEWLPMTAGQPDQRKGRSEAQPEGTEPLFHKG